MGLMKLFPQKKYALVTSFTVNEICQLLIKKSFTDPFFDVGIQENKYEPVSFTAAFYYHHHKGLIQYPDDRSHYPECTGILVPQNDGRTDMQIMAELGPNQKLIGFVWVILNVIASILMIAGFLMRAEEVLNVLETGIILIAVNILVYMVMYLYIQYVAANTRKFFMRLLDAH